MKHCLYYAQEHNASEWGDLCASFGIEGTNLSEQKRDFQEELERLENSTRIVLLAPREFHEFDSEVVSLLGVDLLPDDDWVLILGRDIGGFTAAERWLLSERTCSYYTIPVVAGTAIWALQAATITIFEQFRQGLNRWR